MIKGPLSFLLAALILLSVYSCKKEFSVEHGPKSHGRLASDISGNCEPINAAGNFILGHTMNDSNFLEVSVDVTQPGSYTIQSDTVNGYHFNTSGSFTDTGRVIVRLPGAGTPVSRGTDHFTISYDSSSCAVAVTVLNNVPVPADYSLSGAPTTCMNFSVKGLFITNIALDTSNRVEIQVEVTVPGTYSITTNTVNGYSFSAAGVFTATGIQTVPLAATGKPIAAGSNSFTVTAAASSCSFTVEAAVPVPAINTDYFPLTANSFWTYDHNFFLTDSVKRMVDGTATRNTMNYVVMSEKVPTDPVHPLFFRKTGIEYYEFCRVDKYTGSFVYGDPVEGDILFLKDVLTTGEEWISQEFSGTASFGQKLSIIYHFTCIDANAVVSVKGKIFANVYKVRMMPSIKSEFAGYGYTNEVYDLYYAKGIGLIYTKKTSGEFLQNEEHLLNWHVN
jgi:hypothetical protein